MKPICPKSTRHEERKPYVDEKTLQVQFSFSEEADVKPLDNEALDMEFLSLIDIGKKLESIYLKMVSSSFK
jgi:hypothetical protein